MKSIFSRLLAVCVLTVGISAQVIVFRPVSVHAAPCEPVNSILGLPTWYKYLDGELSGGKCSPTIDNTRDALPIGIAVLEAALRIAGLVAVVMVFLGAFKFITSQGNPENATGARKTVINALIGLVIVIISTGVVSFIGNSVNTNNSQSGANGSGAGSQQRR